MADGLGSTDRLPREDVRVRRANARLGIQTAEPSGLTVSHAGIAVVVQSPVFVDASGIGLNIAETYLLISGTDLTFASPITGDITTTKDIKLDSDTGEIFFGDGQDMSVVYNGTDGIINTSLVGASDLVVTCGAAKTLELTTGVYRDTNVGALALSGPPGLQPGVVNFLDSAGADTDIATYGIAIGEGVSGAFELQHDYKEGTDPVFHVHWQGITAPGGGTDNVKWQLTYTIARDGAVVAPKTVIVKESAVTTQYVMNRSDFAAITGTSLLIGDQFLFTLERIAASADDYAGEALLATVGIHYQVDTLGSRQVATK